MLRWPVAAGGLGAPVEWTTGFAVTVGFVVGELVVLTVGWVVVEAVLEVVLETLAVTVGWVVVDVALEVVLELVLEVVLEVVLEPLAVTVGPVVVDVVVVVGGVNSAGHSEMLGGVSSRVASGMRT
jgi:hypothetical protein